MFDKLRVVPRFVVRHPFVVLLIASLLTGLGASQALTLRVEADIVTLLAAVERRRA